MSQKVRILSLSPEIPNDTMSFVPSSPLSCALRSKKLWSLCARPKTGVHPSAVKTSTAGLVLRTATDADYDFVRKLVEAPELPLSRSIN